MSANNPEVGRSPDVSVVVTTRYGATVLRGCLQSLTRQTVGSQRYELVVVQHGPEDGTTVAVDDVRVSGTELRITHEVVGDVTAGEAKNLGLRLCRAPCVTFVRDADSVSAGFLEGVLASAGRAPITQAAVLTRSTGDPSWTASDPALEEVLSSHGRLVRASRLRLSFTNLAGKLLETATVREIGFDALDLGDEVAFLARLLESGRTDVMVTHTTTGSAYFRLADRRPNARLDKNHLLSGLAALINVRGLDPGFEPIRQTMIESATIEVNRYLKSFPDDHQGAIQQRRTESLDEVDLRALNRGVARDLAVLYNSVPFVDTSANVAARRVRDRGLLVDVVSSDLSRDVRRDHSSNRVWEEFVGHRVETPTPPSVVWWTGVDEFCRRGLSQIRNWERSKGRYRSMYSRSMYPASHALASLYKIDNPAAAWTAEFSDPYSIDVQGKPRVSTGDPEALHRTMLIETLRRRGLWAPEDNMLLLVEACVYALADRILFTNDSQLEFMLENFPDPVLADVARAKASVDPHPTLDPEFYSMVKSDYALSTDRVNLAYFGAFYPTRGIEEVVAALRHLSDAERGRIHLSVFTSKTGDIDLLDIADLSDAISVNRYVDFLEYLNLTTRFDVLIIKDYETRGTHSRNPYIPSKWSDFQGSGRSVWGIVEASSELSRKPLDFQSSIGDVDGAVRVMRRLIDGE